LSIERSANEALAVKYLLSIEQSTNEALAVKYLLSIERSANKALAVKYLLSIKRSANEALTVKYLLSIKWSSNEALAVKYLLSIEASAVSSYFSCQMSTAHSSLFNMPSGSRQPSCLVSSVRARGELGLLQIRNRLLWHYCCTVQYSIIQCRTKQPTCMCCVQKQEVHAVQQGSIKILLASEYKLLFKDILLEEKLMSAIFHDTNKVCSQCHIDCNQYLEFK